MANRFEVTPVNPLAALMAGVQGYDKSQQAGKQAELEAAFKQAGQQIQSGGLDNSALGQLFGLGPPAAPMVTAAAALLRAKGDGQGVYGTPIYGTNEKGETVLGAIGKQGQWHPIETPGVQVTPGVKTIDTGTGTLLIDSRSGRPLGAGQGGAQGMPGGQGAPGPAPGAPQGVQSVIPKDIAGKQAAEERGTAQGKAEVTLPSVLSKSQQAIKLIDDMVAHPGRETSTGISGKLDPRNYIPGTDATNFRVRQKQLQGKTFLEAFESLKGGGAITEVEGTKAEQAIARLDLSQSDDEYKNALTELRSILVNGMRLAVQRAKGGGLPPADVRVGPQATGKDQGRVGNQSAPVDWQTYFGGQ